MIKNFTQRGHALLPGLCCSLLLLSACATVVPVEKTIEERAMTRWNTVLSGDYAGAYEFLSPGYRSSVSSTQYQRSLLLSKVKWTGVSYLGSECTESACKVKISLNFTLYGGIPGIKSFDGNDVIEESWVQSDNQWYLVPKQ